MPNFPALHSHHARSYTRHRARRRYPHRLRKTTQHRSRGSIERSQSSDASARAVRIGDRKQHPTRASRARTAIAIRDRRIARRGGRRRSHRALPNRKDARCWCLQPGGLGRSIRSSSTASNASARFERMISSLPQLRQRAMQQQKTDTNGASAAAQRRARGAQDARPRALQQQRAAQGQLGARGRGAQAHFASEPGALHRIVQHASAPHARARTRRWRRVV